jgi:Ribonuclease G/E
MARRPPIERLLAEGQNLMAGDRDPIGTKGARLSTQVSIAAGCWFTCPRTRTSFRSASKTRKNGSTF